MSKTQWRDGTLTGTQLPAKYDLVITDDDAIGDAAALFPDGYTPNAIFMGKAALNVLRKSRTATNPTGAPAPFPKEIQGIAGNMIPIYVTGGISNTEALTL